MEESMFVPVSSTTIATLKADEAGSLSYKCWTCHRNGMFFSHANYIYI